MLRQRDDISYFRSNSHLEESRLDTPGFMLQSCKDSNIDDKNGTSETRNSTTNTLNSNARPNSRLRFKRINITKKFKKLENLNAINSATNRKILFSKHKITKAPSLNLNSNIYRADLNNFLNFDSKWNKNPCTWGLWDSAKPNANGSNLLTEKLSHERSVASRHTSIFDQNLDSQITFNKNWVIENNNKIEEKLKKLGKILNRHQRIESVINHVEPIDISRKRHIVYNDLIHLSPLKLKVASK